MRNKKPTASDKVSRPKITFERNLGASAEDVWKAWTTRKGFEAWWGPEGFTTTVRRFDLRPGGKFEYAMTASSPEAIQAMKAAGMDLTSVAGGTFIEVTPPHRLVYETVADFIPDVAPYEVMALVEIRSTAQGVRLVVTEDAMHDDLWTQRSRMGMDSTLDRLVKFLEVRGGGRRTTR